MRLFITTGANIFMYDYIGPCNLLLLLFKNKSVHLINVFI